ncbi:GntR family transcriptional regulator [Sphingomonas sp. NSE70-1]|uniref:GntR family transcriptional regulator n=1 Tax=Sphingomonas caseinilyticus TaxID=2908205 RepID=A0ABT0RRL8_9SPHN|nr:GntR family transcriptional regulator [Sphingomonas caseinilyticus]MCL6697652.1 GntR family transcriptional regulator [Sphingomonas caseinilyticus]
MLEIIERRHLRDQLGEAIRDRIVRQRLPANQSIGENALASELGVSRTPVRETLLGLERDGFVKAVPGRGFVVLPLSAEEARQLYPIVWSLERLALSDVTEVSPDLIAKLRGLNRNLESATTPQERKQIDADWHRCLISVSGNQRLAAMLEGAKASIARYEHAYMDAAGPCDQSIEEHEHIASLLDESPALAADAIEAHWRRGLAVILVAIEGTPQA